MIRRWIDVPLLALGMALLAMTPWLAGRTLGAIFMALIVPAMLALPMAGPYLRRPAVITLGLLSLASGGVATYVGGTATGAQMAVLAGGLALGTAGLVALLARLRLPIDPARAVAGTLLLAWLSWPVWMAPQWTDPAFAAWLDPLVTYQPLLAANGAAISLGPWSHQPLAYRYLMNLGQDIPYALPPTAWPAALAHAAGAGILLVAAAAGRRCYNPAVFRSVVILLLCAVLGAGGCNKTETAAQTPKPPMSPVLIHLPGIAGTMAIDRELVGGLMQSGVAPAARFFPWADDRRGLPALTGYEQNRQEAIKLTKLLTSVYRQDPRRRITLTAHSGGTAVAVWALEQLPRDVQVDYLVLIASALSPDYDLSPALRHVRRDAIAFYSAHDSIVLGSGTRMLGTMDRLHTDAAGYVGFRQPLNADPKQYAKLRQLAHQREWQRWGNFGDHIGVMSRPFATHVLGPMLDPIWPTSQPFAQRLPE